MTRLASEHDVEIWEGRLQPSRAKLAEKTREVDGLLCLLTDRIDRSVILRLGRDAPFLFAQLLRLGKEIRQASGVE